MKKKLVLAIVGSLFLAANSYGEIENVQVQWQPRYCNAICSNNLGTQLQKVPGIAQILLNKEGGTVDLPWQLNYPFDYNVIKRTLRLVGIGQMVIRVKVRGRITFDNNNTYLTSTGDNTNFILLSNNGTATNRYNLVNRTSSPETRQTLEQAAMQNKLATVEGPILETTQYSAPWLIVDKLTFELTDLEKQGLEQLLQEKEQQKQEEEQAAPGEK